MEHLQSGIVLLSVDPLISLANAVEDANKNLFEDFVDWHMMIELKPKVP